MKLLMFVPSFRGGGAERVFVNLANYFYENGVDVDFVVVSGDGPNKELLDRNIKIIDLKKKSVYLSVFSLSSVIRDLKPDVIFSTMMSCNLVSIVAKKLAFTDARVVIREANVIPNRELFVDKVRDNLSRVLYPLCDKIILNSPDTCKDIQKLVGSKIIPKSVVIGNPVLSLNDVKHVSLQRQTFFRGKEGCIRIVTVGRLVKQKNFHLALDVAKIFKENDIPIQMDIYGDGPLLNELNVYAKQIDVSERVNFMGYSKEIDLLLPTYDVFLLTSLWEGFGNVIIEALAAGLPVVLSDCPGGPRFIVDSDEIGVICSYNPKEMFEMINFQVAFNNEEKVRLRRQRACDFSIEVTGKKYLTEIKNLVQLTLEFMCDYQFF